MPHTYLCFVWHMHQPFYKDLGTGEYQLPWTRMHALKDYYGMVKVLEDFPQIRQTFNLVPSMMIQIDEYANGQAQDPFLRAALKPAEELTDAEKEFILSYFFQANIPRMIYRYPRYGELFEAWRESQFQPARARRIFTNGSMRDLQVLSQLAWFDEEFLEKDADVVGLVKKGRDYTLADQKLMAAKQAEILGMVMPVYRDFSQRDQIELSVTPFYHPILPLLCDSDIARVSHPDVPLPPRFRYPQDARWQISAARSYAMERLGVEPQGMWPSEGSVSDEALGLAAEEGFRWAATDNGVLSATLHRLAGASETYRPYLWNQGGRQIHLLFRDHFLSDLIGFVYSRMEPKQAAQHFLNTIEENCRPILAAGRDALVPIILDGENAWEYYEHGGRPFLRELYRRITEHDAMTAVTVSDALARVEPEPLGHVFPGSWISANFDVWIGSQEDNRAWEFLLRARQTYDEVLNGPRGEQLSDGQKKLAFEELLIAEGSDWCWWYGPEHDSENRPDFDELYRDHLTNVYRSLGARVPDELARPILKTARRDFHQPPVSPIRARIDGEVSSYYEWMGAGHYAVDVRSGSMHGHTPLVHGIMYGTDGSRLYLRLDLVPEAEFTQIHLNTDKVCLSLLGNPAVEVARDRIFEASVSLTELGLHCGDMVKFQIALLSENLPLDIVPQQGYIEFSTADPTE